MMDGGSWCVFFVVVLLCVSPLLKLLAHLEQKQAERAAAAADEELQRTNPQLWGQKELLKLEKERIAAEQKRADEQARQENARRNVGLGWMIFRNIFR